MAEAKDNLKKEDEKTEIVIYKGKGRNRELKTMDELKEEYGQETIPVTYKNIKKCLILIESRFDVFMDKLSRDEYDDLEEMLD